MQAVHPEFFFRNIQSGLLEIICSSLSHVAACFKTMQFSSDLIQLRQRGSHVTTASRRHSTGPVQPSATRILCFDQARSTPESSANASFPSNPNQISAGYSGRSFYGSHSADQHWQPGETIPTYVPESPIPDSPIATSTPTQHHQTIFPTFSPHPPQNKDIMDMLQKFQSSVETQLASVSSSLSSVSTRITELESQQRALEREVKGASKIAVSSSPRKYKRKRDVPTALQSKIRRVHASFNDDKQIDLTQPINSKFNSKVVENIIESIGTDEHSETLIRKGITAHRKYLVAKMKRTATPIKKKKRERSRQQRSFERRGSVVKSGREAELWEEVTPDMMSEEEEEGNGYVRHPPSYRSEGLNKFIEKLDKRLDKKQSKHPRVARRLGSPPEKPLPHMCKKWVIKRDLRERENEQTTAGVDSENQSSYSESDAEGNTSSNSSDIL